MSNPTQTQALLQQKRDVRDMLNSPRAKEEIAKVLPKHLTAERMLRVALTATLKTPSLLQCTPESVLNAVLFCSQCGLEPDGRLAHLIPYGNVVQVILDYKGLVVLAKRNGGMDQVYADKVCERDDFKAFVEDGKKKIHHSIDWSKPRGSVYAYYAVTGKEGVIDWEVMTTEEVESVRQRSKAKDSGPWKTDYDEMGKKTVLRRMSKRWDLLPEIGELINSDDDVPPPLTTVTVSPPKFAKPALPPASKGNPKTETVEENGEPAVEPEAPPPPETTTTPENPVKKVRTLCKESKVREGHVIDFLQSIGVIEPDVKTIEEVQLKAPEALTMVVNQWKEVVERVNSMGA